jgi:uncharacterized membrane protein
MIFIAQSDATAVPQPTSFSLILLAIGTFVCFAIFAWRRTISERNPDSKKRVYIRASIRAFVTFVIAYMMIGFALHIAHPLPPYPEEGDFVPSMTWRVIGGIVAALLIGLLEYWRVIREMTKAQNKSGEGTA